MRAVAPVARLPGSAPKWKQIPRELNRAFLIGEAGKIRWDIIEYLYGTGLDLGCGSNKISKNAIGIDREDSWLGRPIEANVKGDIEKLAVWETDSLDFVFSSHALEEIEDYVGALKEWWRVVKPGGYLVLYLPRFGLCPPRDLPLSEGGMPPHKHDGFEPEQIENVMRDIGGWDLVRNEPREEADEFSFLQVYRKRTDGVQTRPYAAPRPEKTAAVIRYGGIGDHLMTGTILPVLREEGWHVTYVTNPAGKEYMKNNPNIDEWIVDTAALTNEDLLHFWRALEGRFDRVLNMMNSVENMSLPQPASPLYYMPPHLRKVWYSEHNYNDMTHAWAGVDMPGELDQHYYETEEEAKWAEEILVPFPRPVLWCLAGSSVNKASPRTWEAVKLVLDADPGVTVLLTGGKKEELLLADFPDHPRLVKELVGRCAIGHSLALAKRVPVIVGPETGLLNSVAMDESPHKVVTLSHSSEKNLCKYWRAYTALTPDPTVAPCAPCHRLHWGWDHCRRGQSGAALCVEAIAPARIAQAVLRAMDSGR